MVGWVLVLQGKKVWQRHCTKRKCDMHDWPARELKPYQEHWSKLHPCLSKPTTSLSCPPLYFLPILFLAWATPTSPNGVAPIPLLSIEEALVSSALSSEEEYVLNCPYLHFQYFLLTARSLLQTIDIELEYIILIYASFSSISFFFPFTCVHDMILMNSILITCQFPIHACISNLISNCPLQKPEELTPRFFFSKIFRFYLILVFDHTFLLFKTKKQEIAFENQKIIFYFLFLKIENIAFLYNIKTVFQNYFWKQLSNRVLIFLLYFF